MRGMGLFLVCALALVAADDPFVGVWKVNFDKSTTGFAPPVRPSSATVRYEAVEGGMKVTSEVLMPDGKRAPTPAHEIHYDGKEYPRIPGAPAGDVVINRRPDRFTEETIYKRDGKIRGTATRVVSPDGRTMTLTGKSTGPDGKETVTVTVFDKQ